MIWSMVIIIIIIIIIITDVWSHLLYEFDAKTRSHELDGNGPPFRGSAIPGVRHSGGPPSE